MPFMLMKKYRLLGRCRGEPGLCGSLNICSIGLGEVHDLHSVTAGVPAPPGPEKLALCLEIR